MQRTRIACTVILCLLFAAVGYAQQPSDQSAPQQEEPKAHPAATPPPQPPEAKPEQQENAKPEKQEKEKEKEAKPASKPSKSEAGAREQSGQPSHAHPAGKSGHIPDAKFRASFGRSHTFTIGKPVIVNNQPTFQYAGYSFIIVDWPIGWAYTDDCYIDYIDGDYFLFDLLHPGEPVALIVVM